MATEGCTGGCRRKWFRRLTVFTAFACGRSSCSGDDFSVAGSGGLAAVVAALPGECTVSITTAKLVESGHHLFATLVGLLMAVTVGSTLLWYHQTLFELADAGRYWPAAAYLGASHPLGESPSCCTSANLGGAHG